MTPADLLTLLGLLSVVTFVGSLVAVPWLIGRMRADYFLTHWQVVQARHRRHPALALTVFLARNALGLLLVAAGLAMLFLPGQGLLTVLIGALLMPMASLGLVFFTSITFPFYAAWRPTKCLAPRAWSSRVR